MVKKRTKMTSKSGFTLIELMITVVVFTTGLVAILGSTVSMYRQQQYSDYESLSSQWANLLLVELQDDVKPNGGDPNDTSDLVEVTGHLSGLALDDGTPTSLFPTDPTDADSGEPVDFELDGLGAVATAQMVLLSSGNPCEVQLTINVYPNGNTDGAIELQYITSRYVSY